MNYFPDKLQLEDVGSVSGIRRFSLLRRYRYISSFGIIHIPEGTITDGASVPRPFWNIFEPFGEYFGAAIIHDYLYSSANTEFDRWASDSIFREAMFNIGVPWYRREPIYQAVRMFGSPYFKGLHK